MDPRADALYAAPQQEFVARRDALVKEMKAAGEKELAAEVKGLARPTLAAWALNQVARSSPEEVQALREIGDRMRSAQRAALSGKPGDLQAASGDRHKQVAKVGRLAAKALEAGGYAAPSHSEAITQTLDAAVIDAEIATALEEGRLTRELASTGLDLLLAPGPFATPPAKAAVGKPAARGGRARQAPEPKPEPEPEPEKPTARESARDRARKEAEEKAAELEAAAVAARARADEAAQASDAAHARAVALTAEAEAATKEARRARSTARDALNAATAAEAAARQAAGRAARGSR